MGLAFGQKWVNQSKTAYRCETLTEKEFYVI